MTAIIVRRFKHKMTFSISTLCLAIFVKRGNKTINNCPELVAKVPTNLKFNFKLRNSLPSLFMTASHIDGTNAVSWHEPLNVQNAAGCSRVIMSHLFQNENIRFHCGHDFRQIFHLARPCCQRWPRRNKHITSLFEWSKLGLLYEVTDYTSQLMHFRGSIIQT